ncbi:MAG TPA: YraN family protein [Hyphomicrobiaceae bacterium]|mgnify:CR=1 FL=1|nr:YraN family protein [Hyphomicrobiaceae bacterium]
MPFAQHDQTTDRIRRNRRGMLAELVAAALLVAKGYRILSRRAKTPLGEIDLVAARGGRVAFVEVKSRSTWQACEAAITPRTASRVRRAADLWLQRNARFREHEQGFDVVFVVPYRIPRHIPNGL